MNCTFINVGLLTDPSLLVNDNEVAAAENTFILMESVEDIVGTLVSCTYFFAVLSMTK